MLKFISLINVFDSLGRILGGTSDSSYCEENVLVEDVTRKALDIGWEGGGGGYDGGGGGYGGGGGGGGGSFGGAW